MNVKLKRNFSFTSGIVYQDSFKINLYSLTASMITNTSDPVEQNVAYERIKYWVHEVLTDAVFIVDKSQLVPAYLSTGQRIIITPEEPVDQLIGYMAFTKFNAITEGKIIITSVEITSVHGDDMTYVHNDDEVFLLPEYPKWWTDPRPAWGEKSRKKSSNVISMDRMPEWKELGLDWEMDDEEADTEEKCVIVTLPTHDKK